MYFKIKAIKTNTICTIYKYSLFFIKWIIYLLYVNSIFTNIPKNYFDIYKSIYISIFIKLRIIVITLSSTKLEPVWRSGAKESTNTKQQ